MSRLGLAGGLISLAILVAINIVALSRVRHMRARFRRLCSASFSSSELTAAGVQSVQRRSPCRRVRTPWAAQTTHCAGVSVQENRRSVQEWKAFLICLTQILDDESGPCIPTFPAPSGRLVIDITV